MRVAFLTNIVSPYRRPLLERLAATPGWVLRVFVDAESEFDRSWSVDTSRLALTRTRSVSVARRAKTPGSAGFQQRLTLHVPLSVPRDLARFKPDVVISHELGARTALAAAYARLCGVPLVIWSYHSLVSASAGSPRLRRSLLRQASAVVGMGSEAREVLRSWGVPEERIVDAPNAADHETIAARLAAPEAEARRAAIRARCGGRKLALVAGRLVPLKGTRRLLETWDRLPRALRDSWQLVFMGEGPLAKLVARHPEALHVGHVETEAVPDWLSAADLHVFPSLGDVWGLAVNEALQCGTLTLASRRAACTADMIVEGVSGLTYDPAAPHAWRRLQSALEHPAPRALAAAGRERAAAFSQDRMAEGFREAVRIARSRGRSRRSA